MKISDFYRSMYVDASSYKCLTMIGSVTDGLKNSGRKVLTTVLDKNIKNNTVKVSRLKSTVSEYTEYIHGEDNLASVTVNMARSYTGSNNLPLLEEDGNFGKRFITDASADRYISTAGRKYLEYIFPKSDRDILIKQEFEGAEIEPRYFSPIVPMLLINGSNGVAIGFAQIILPRPFKQIVKITENYLETGKVKIPKPGWEGFKGKVLQDKNNKKKWIIYGKFDRINTTTLEITEVPVGLTLKQYLNILDTLKENKVISSFKDKSEDNKFHFIIKVPRKFMEMTDEEIFEVLKLKDNDKRFVENYTSMGENNRIFLSDSPEELFLEYARVREEYYEKRKSFLIEKTKEEIKTLASKILFIRGVNDEKIIINKKPKNEIIKQLEPIDRIIEIDGSYDYLLRMPLYSLTKEKINEFMQQLKDKKFLFDDYKTKDPKTFWKEDLITLKQHIS